jgi:hypothetical protein
MTTEVCFFRGATCGSDAEIAKAPLFNSNRVALTGRQPVAASRSSNTSEDLLPVTVNVTRKDPVKTAALVPIIEVVFTVGGPVVYERTNEQFAPLRNDQ